MSVELASLWERFRRAADHEARAQLVAHYMPMARKIAAGVYGLRVDSSTSFDDYLQYARVGLIESVDRFQARNGASFETFSAYRIRGAILTGIARESEAIAQASFWRARGLARSESLEQNFRGSVEEASLEELAAFTVELAIGVVLDAVGEEATEEVAANPYAAMEMAQLQALLHRLVDKLPANERDLIEGHYFKQLEFQEVAADLELTKGRVSQLHARALQRLRQMLAAHPTLDRKL
jgi:RNA polymerase sigma factor for flagellar operon FliA